MAMRTHLEFRSPEFPAYPGEEDEINPGIFGRRLAEFLRDSLDRMGREPGEIYAEDWGWVVPLHHDAFPLWIGCAIYDPPDCFLVFIEPSKPFVRRWFRRIDTTEAVEDLARALETALSEASGVTELCWRTDAP